MFEKISFSDYFDSAKANGIEREVMLALEASMNELFNKKPKEYEGTMLAIHERINGKHFDKLTAHIGVEGLKNVDGTKGAHFSYDEVSAAIADWSLTIGGLSQETVQVDMYYAVNMLYSDTSNIYGNSIEPYAKLAKALYFDDPDMVDGKLWRQYLATEV